MENQTWYSTQKIPYSFEIKKEKKTEFCQEVLSALEISLTNWKTLANFFPFPHVELKMTKMKFDGPGKRSPEKDC